MSSERKAKGGKRWGPWGEIPSDRDGRYPNMSGPGSGGDTAFLGMGGDTRLTSRPRPHTFSSIAVENFVPKAGRAGLGHLPR